MGMTKKRNPRTEKLRCVSINDEIYKQAKIIGDGNFSGGIKIAVSNVYSRLFDEGKEKPVKEYYGDGV